MTECSAQLVADWQNAQAWSTQRVAPHRQFDCWREFVLEAHMHWDIRRLDCERFPAFIRQGRFAGFRTAHLTAEAPGIVGTRGAREIARDDEALYSFIYVAAGAIRLDIGECSAELFPGHCALWDTTRPMRFTTGADLRQITFSMPQARLRRVLHRADDYVGQRIDTARGGSARMFVDHMLSLDRNFGNFVPSTADHILNATTELLAAALESSVPLSEERRDQAVLREICRHIRACLDDETLGAGAIARANGISERQLYRLFDLIDTTPAAWIREQRLEECRRELRATSAADRSVTDIALRWGFRDSGTFSKIFRRAYGLTPSAVRCGAS